MKSKEELARQKAEWYQKNKHEINARRRDYIRNWQKAHRERMALLRRRWHEQNPDKVKQGRFKYEMTHTEACAERRKRWRDSHKEQRANSQRVRLAHYKNLIVKAYGGCCSCCGEAEIRFLTVEHLNRDGMTHRKPNKNFYQQLVEQGFPKDQGLTILCMNCNWSERNGLPCPHKLAQMEIFKCLQTH